MEIGDWKATLGLNELYREIRDLGLETNIAELETFGFTVIERAISPDLVDALSERIREVSARRLELDSLPEDGSSHTGTTQLMNGMLAEGPMFEQAVLHPVAVAFMRYMLGDSYVLNSLHAFVKGADAPAAALHIDSPMPDPFPRYSHVANVNFLLTDYTAAGGAIRFVPASHRFGRGPTPDELAMEHLMVPIEAPRGSLAVFHGTTWHGVCPKLTSGLRLNLIYYGCRPYVRPQEFYLDRLPQDVFDRNPEHFTRIVGADLPFTDTTYDLMKLAATRGTRAAQHR